MFRALRPRRLALAAALCAALAAGGCGPRLSERHEFFAPPAADDGTASETVALLVRHRALQQAQHACASPAPAKAVVCPERARAPAAFGASSNAYRRWATDAVRDLPPLSATAASAGGN